MKEYSLVLICALIAFSFFGCASAHKVPSIDGNDLPQVKFSSMQPRKLAVFIKNHRKANLEKKNAEEVEKALLRTLTESFSRSGIAVQVKTPNQLRILIDDYDATGDQGECVKIVANLAIARGQAVAESFACHVLKHWIGFKLGGDVEESYKSALGMVLKELDKQIGGAGADARL